MAENISVERVRLIAPRNVTLCSSWGPLSKPITILHKLGCETASIPSDKKQMEILLPQGWTHAPNEDFIFDADKQRRLVLIRTGWVKHETILNTRFQLPMWFERSFPMEDDKVNWHALQLRDTGEPSPRSCMFLPARVAIDRKQFNEFSAGLFAALNPTLCLHDPSKLWSENAKEIFAEALETIAKTIVAQLPTVPVCMSADGQKGTRILNGPVG